MMRLLFTLMTLAFMLVHSTRAASLVVVSEIQTGGKESDDEFIELWNPGTTTIALEEWSLQYKTATGKTITKKNFEKGAKIPGRGFYLIARKEYTGAAPPDMKHGTFSLADKGGNVFLVINQEMIADAADPDIVDRVAWGIGDAPEGTAVTPPDAGQSIERRPGGTQGHEQDTNNNQNDFLLQGNPTPRNSASPTIANTQLEEPKQASSTTTDPPPTPSSSSSGTPLPPSNERQKEGNEGKEKPRVEEKPRFRFSEIFPNPYGNDDQEFIELENPTDGAIDLFGWRVETNTGQSFLIAEKEGLIVVKPKTFFSLPRTTTGLTLQNIGGTVRLFTHDRETAVDVLTYPTAASGQSYARKRDERFAWTLLPTPGAQNLIAIPNRPPIPVIAAPNKGAAHELLVFDASDSVDPDRDPLVYTWNFGDGKGESSDTIATYLYDTDGSYVVRLTVFDGHVEANTTATIVIGNAPTKPPEHDSVPTKDVIAHSQISSPPSPTYQSRIGAIRTIEGDVVESKGTSMIIDTGTEEVKVAFTAKNKLKKPFVRLGERLTITGIVDKTSSGMRLLPRTLQDVERRTEERLEASRDTTLAILPPRSSTRSFLPYLGMTIGTGIVGALIIFLKRFRKEGGVDERKDE